MLKRSNTLSLIQPEKTETSLVFQNLKLNNHDIDYAIRVTRFLLILLLFGVFKMKNLIKKRHEVYRK